MRLERRRLELAGGQNRPALNGSPVDILDYMESLCEGFAKIYRLLMQLRPELQSASGPLASFCKDEIRILFRPTRTYVRLLYESFHPDLLHDQLDRDRLFERLWEGVKQQSYLSRVIPAEQRALQKQDVPLFLTQVSSRTVWTDDHEQISDFLEKSGLDCVYERLEALNEADLQRQMWFIRSSLATLTVAADQTRWPTYAPIEKAPHASQSQILAAAAAIGDRLQFLALREADEVNWVGLAFATDGRWVLRPLGPELYNGLAGIALFLAQLGAIAHEPHYTQLARATLNSICRQLETSRDSFKSIGGFMGWGGILYCYLQIGALWKDQRWLCDAEEIVQRISSLVEQDIYLDVMGGSAGCIPSLLALHDLVPNSKALDVALQCGQKLVNAAQPAAGGMAWLGPVSTSNPLGGFGHGAAGYSWALLQLFSRTGKEEFKNLAFQAIEYERSLYSDEVENWRDLRGLNRKNPDPNQFRVAWCHGAAGVGMGRLGSLQYLDTRSLHDLQIALKTTRAKGFGTNHSLCHGDLGNLDLLLQAAAVFDAGWNEEATRVIDTVVESISREGWLCGVPLGVETPGLMTGLAGIGYGLLRAAFPDRVPSVLMLENARDQ
jgi:type 2 lantibiotic biosynthesis protein LanM